ncbi:MAG: 23S rRNA (pseudouridine(1915)-N(3))-methyltransferase RlmH [Alphaproteobacteria bacterium]|nr:23S rRNA (pseudouridine(1915)-N(3))-methyltransferase RlmH [Alphaproteobacteria bacterium]
MRVLVLAVGRDRPGPTAELVDTYLKRCPWRIDIVEIPQKNQGDRTRRLREEAGKIRQALPDNAAVIALDERGDDLSSRAFAEQIERFRHDGRSALAFIIGGADGLDPSLIEAADRRLAFGRAVWPHRLVRVMLAEQLYRASTILSGHPYHRD